MAKRPSSASDSEAGSAKKKNKPLKKTANKAAVKSNPVEDKLERDILWEENLTWKMINAVTDNTECCEALFPGPGANRSTANGGGKTKTEYHSYLAEVLFDNHRMYGPAYRADKTEKKARAKWAVKIKNQLDKITRDVREHMEEMEKTGNGIHSKDEIDFTRDNRFTNLARQVLEECPWYYEMKALIAQRPNMQLAGLGNNMTAIDESVLQGGSASDDEENIPGDVADHDGGLLADDDNLMSDSDDKKPSVPVETKRTEGLEGKEKTSWKGKRVKLEDKFIAISTEEEKTRQLALQSKIAATSIAKARIEAETTIKCERLRLRAALHESKLRHKERMRAMQAGIPYPSRELSSLSSLTPSTSTTSLPIYYQFTPGHLSPPIVISRPI